MSNEIASIIDVQQGTEEWHAQRIGRVTSSRIADVMAKGRGGAPSVSRKKYVNALALERYTGKKEITYANDAMARGIELEPLARSAYESFTKTAVREVGFIVHPDFNWTGSSPDGLVGDDGLVEIKCPLNPKHHENLFRGGPDPQYHWQMQHQMWVTGRAWCDFVSWNPEFGKLDLSVCRVFRNDVIITQMVEQLQLFNEEVEKSLNDMIELEKQREA